MRNFPQCGLMLCLLLGCSDSGQAPPAKTNEKSPVGPTAPLIPAPKSTPELPGIPPSVEIIRVDLAPHEKFLTIDVPRGVTIDGSSTIEIDDGDDFYMHIIEVRDPYTEKLIEEILRQMRGVKRPAEVVIDTPDHVLSGDTSFYSYAGKFVINERKYWVTTWIRCSKSTAMLVAACAGTLRRTEANEIAEAKMRAAKTKLTALGCKFSRTVSSTVRVSGKRVTDDDLAMLADIPFLTWVEISAPNVTVACLEHLRKLPRLTSVRLFSSHIDGTWLTPLHRLPRLDHLLITKASIADDDWGNLAGITRLQHLNVSVPVSNQCLRAISQLPNLVFLVLEDVGIDDAMLVNLKPKPKEDFYLLLRWNPITDAGLEHLHGLTLLKSLDVQDTNVTAAGVKKLKAALPKCDVDFE